MVCIITFNQVGWTWSGYSKVDGFMYNSVEDSKAKKNPILAFEGRWLEYLKMTRDGQTSTLWEASKPIDKQDW